MTNAVKKIKAESGVRVVTSFKTTGDLMRPFYSHCSGLRGNVFSLTSVELKNTGSILWVSERASWEFTLCLSEATAWLSPLQEAAQEKGQDGQ